VADDFVFAFRRLMDPATGAQYANLLYTLKNAEKINKGEMPLDALGARAIDDKTLELILENPTPYFIASLAHLTGVPLHRASVTAYGKDFTKPGNLVTNGAFMLKAYTPNDQLVLVKNPNYYDAANVALDTEIFHPIEDRSAALRRFMAGEIHSYNDVPVDQVAFAREKLGDEFRVSPYLGSYFYAFDTRRPPLSDARVRNALSMAVDREFLADKIWKGTMNPGYSFVPSGMHSYDPPSTVAWKNLDRFDREDEARKLLSAAGYGSGGKKLAIEIRYNTSENHRATAIAIADMWKAIGVDTRLTNTDSNSHYSFLREKNPYDVARSGWIADYPDAQNFLFLAESDNKGLNVANYTNPSFDALMQRAGRENNAVARANLLHEAETLLLKDQSYLVLLEYRSRNLVSRKLRGWEPNVMDHHGGRFISIAP
jgi:peptide/nickel transport system substrate-binding protein/oligopeptide transport system substrate-binding protein